MNNSNYGINIQERLAEEQAKSSLRIYENEVKQELSLQKEQIRWKKKAQFMEEQRELQKSQFEAVTIDEDGRIGVKTENLQIQSKTRKVANFSEPRMYIFEHLENRHEKIYCVTFRLNGMADDKRTFAMLKAEQSGNPNYIIKKISAVGGMIIGSNPQQKKEYALQLLYLLIARCQKTYIIPERRGWYIDESGKMKFFQDRWTWKEAVKCAK